VANLPVNPSFYKPSRDSYEISARDMEFLRAANRTADRLDRVRRGVYDALEALYGIDYEEDSRVDRAAKALEEAVAL